jgi:hypothetical protein
MANEESVKSLQAQIAAMAKTIAEKDKTHKQEIAEKDKTHKQEIAEKDKTIAEKDKTIAERSLRHLITNAFTYVDRTNSKPHCASKTHRKSKLIASNINVKEFPDEAWNASYTSPTDEKEFNVDSETMVVDPAVRILQALIVGLGLKQLVYVSSNRVVAGVELDIVLLYGSQRIPFAAIEVKKPGYEGFDDNIIFQGEDGNDTQAGVTTGQHLDQLNAIRLFGFQSVFGMITNGSKWMLTSTTKVIEEVPDWDYDLGKVLRTNEPVPNDTSPEQNLIYLIEPPVVRIPILAAAAVSVSEEEGLQKTKDSMEEDSMKEDSMEEDSTEEESSESANGRVLYASQVVHITKNAEGVVSGENVVQLIAEFLRLACGSFSKVTPKSVGNSLESCRVLHIEHPELCCFQKKTFTQGVQPGKYLLDKCKLIYLVTSIGRGQHGDCCLGLSEDGTSCCAVKFFLKLKDDVPILQLATQELENWKKVYGNDKDLPACRVGKLPNGGCYLCMPYLKPILISKRLEETENVEEALRRFAKSGYKHNDIRWRHFGGWNDKLFMCDLGDIEKLETEDADAWIAESLRCLEGKRIATEKHNSTPTKNMPLASSTVNGTEAASPVSKLQAVSKRKRV